MTKRGNLLLMLASLVIAIMLWFVVYSETLPTEALKPIRVQLVLSGLDRNEYVAVSPPATFSMVAHGSQDRIDSINENQMYAVADLTNVVPGMHSYPVEIFPENIRDLFPDAATIALQIEPLETKRFRVTWDTRGELSDRTYQLDTVTLDPSTVELSGPRSEVTQVAAVQAIIDLSKVTPNVRSPKQVGLVVLDRRGRDLNDVTYAPIYVTATAIVIPAPEQRLVFVMPSMKGHPATGFVAYDYTVTPSQVTLRGKSSQMAATSVILTKQLDISGISASKDFVVGLQLPPGVTAKTQHVTVHVLVRPQPPIQPNSVTTPSAP